MQTECSAGLFGFAPIEGPEGSGGVRWSEDDLGGRAMLLDATDRQIRMIERFAGCFTDYHAADLGRWLISQPGPDTLQTVSLTEAQMHNYSRRCILSAGLK